MRPYTAILSFLSRQSVVSLLLWIVGASYAETFIKNGFRKFNPEGFWSHSFLETWGFPLWFMYFIGVLEFVSGILLLVPKLRPWGSGVLAVVMLGALVTRSIFGVINGIPAEDAYNFFSDVIFFLSTIAILLFFVSYRNAKISSSIG
ncbi:MAG: DoxX family protein [Bacteroidetes bacterium]|nr:DoxX family protein [Bacteroidota bacterium]